MACNRGASRRAGTQNATACHVAEFNSDPDSILMGSAMNRGRKSRKAEFLAAHPRCIFCGGARSSEEIDHVPSRQLFHARHWPEGYEFPACTECNRATKDVEQIVSVISRMFPDGATEAGRLEMQAGLKALANNNREILLEMRPTANEVRRFLRSHDMRKDPNRCTPEYRLLKADGPQTLLAFGAYARKLFTALHYKHTRKIIPAAGGVAWTRFTNVDSVTNAIPGGIFDLAQTMPVLRRGKIDLDPQFSYRYACSDSGEVAAYLAAFRFSFAILGDVRIDATTFPEEVADRIVRPLQWN